jgi:glutamate-ammonia-ligase adenylyltransferase
MKPSLHEFEDLCGPLKPGSGEEILQRLPEKYFSTVAREDQARHARSLEALGVDGEAWKIDIRRLPDSSVEVTVISFDYPGEFSILTGILGVTGFHIRRGTIYTYSHFSGDEPVRMKRFDSWHGRVRHVKKVGGIRRRKIVDVFIGTLDRGVSFAVWEKEFRLLAGEFFRDLGDGNDDAVRGAKTRLNDLASRALAGEEIGARAAFLPISIEIDSDAKDYTRLVVTSEDTPFFLYSFSSALSLHGISIENVLIDTEGSRIRDVFDFLTLDGRPITDEGLLNKIKFSILFTKQFTYFLDKAPDPHSAFIRFESLLQNFTASFTEKKLEEFLRDPRILQELARLLGTSDFLWEDFVRIQYETLFSLLSPIREGKFLSKEPEELLPALEAFLSGAEDPDRRKDRLNEFKNREIYLIDLDHILHLETDFRFLSRRLTDLACGVLQKAADLAWEKTVKEYGTPRTVANLPAAYTILGLGKLGGEALGYASDIEVLFVFGDNGTTDGTTKISNAEFFERVFRLAASLIETKREGIFQVDLRLRPYGNAGPVGVSIESFCTYFGPQGEAMSYERLALVRLRRIGGDPELGAQVERFRDEFIYQSGAIDLEEFKTIREKQLKEKDGDLRPNAKFSPGALVDLEYTVQILQTLYGKTEPRLRTPRIHTALDELVQTGVMDSGEAETISGAYDFLRSLINGLRMLRGNAQDLFLPAPGSSEFLHLARRIGYEGREGLSPAEELNIDFESHTASIRRFIENHLGRGAVPGERWGSIVDLVLSPYLPEETAKRILRAGNIRDIRRARDNLLRLTDNGSLSRLFAPLSVLAWDLLRRTADPDMALNNWERYAASVPNKGDHYKEMLSQPQKLRMLLTIAAGSQFLANTLVRNPGFLDYVSDPAIVLPLREKKDMTGDIEIFTNRGGASSREDSLRVFRRREILRIGTRDLCLGVPLEEVTQELSGLAEAVIEIELERVWGEFAGSGIGRSMEEAVRAGFCVLAFGKLGGRELNYSSDLDLLGVYADEMEEHHELYRRVFERLIHYLSIPTAEGGLYRIDLRLRPFGSSGRLVSGCAGLERYYRETADLWEIQALLKLRPVAGNGDLGLGLLSVLEPLLLGSYAREEVRRSVDHMRNLTVSRLNQNPARGPDIKNGTGGIRDIEFLLQGLQLVHGADHPGIVTANTLDGLYRLGSEKILPPEICDELALAYRFLRRIEHFLQIYEDRQIHRLPGKSEELEALALRLMPEAAASADFLGRVGETMTKVAEIRRTCL